MPVIEQAGLYKGEIRDFAVTVTRKAELPQFVVTLFATEIYNEKEEIWEMWGDYQQTITGYLVLVTLDKHGEVTKCFNYDQIMEAVGWDGETYSGLAAMELKGTRVQFRVKEDTYEGQTKLKVDLIASEDAEIGLRKLSDKDLSNLDAKFRTASTKKATAAKPSGSKKKTTTSKPPKPPKPPKPGKKSAVDSCTEDEAFNACVEANKALADPVPDKVRDDYWLSHVQEIAADTDNVTDEEFAKIRDATIKDLEIPF